MTFLLHNMMSYLKSFHNNSHRYMNPGIFFKNTLQAKRSYLTNIVVYISLPQKWLPYCLGHYTSNFAYVYNDGKALSNYLSSPLMFSNIWIYGCMWVCPQKMYDITIFCSTNILSHIDFCIKYLCIENKVIQAIMKYRQHLHHIWSYNITSVSWRWSLYQFGPLAITCQ